MTDPIADFLTHIRNACRAKQRRVNIPASSLKIRMAEILKRMNFIRTVEFVDDGKQGILIIRLKYTPDSESVITNIQRISKPGLRIYYDKNKLSAGSRKVGTVVLSTSRGLMTDKEALEAGMGGEALFRVW